MEKWNMLDEGNIHQVIQNINEDYNILTSYCTCGNWKNISEKQPSDATIVDVQVKVHSLIRAHGGKLMRVNLPK